MKNILFVEDDKSLLRGLVLYFKTIYNVYSAEEGNQALSILNNNKIDLVVTDLNMPNGMSGFELIDNINQTLKETKIIVLSGYTENQFSNLKVNKFLTKPIEIKTLNTEIQEQIKND